MFYDLAKIPKAWFPYSFTTKTPKDFNLEQPSLTLIVLSSHENCRCGRGNNILKTRPKVKFQ